MGTPPMNDDGPRVILHLGLGSFHRAHQAAYLQRLIDRGDTTWSITAGNLRPDNEAVAAALARQGGRYTLETVAPDGRRDYQRIESIRRVIAWQPDLAPLIDVAADAATRIVSFTVTEAGYHLDAEGRLDTASAEVVADLAGARRGEAGTTIYGALTALLRARMARGTGPLTLLSCDNLRHNGERLRAALIRFIEAVGDAALLDWVRAHTRCPSSMVDRITPRPTLEVCERVRRATGLDDEAAVMSESFIQWVIEDGFCHGRPAWESVGVEMVDSVTPYEEAKIRLLNATHSAIAWAGALAGHGFIHEAVADPAVRRLAHDYATIDAIPALQPSPLDLAAYRDSVLARFGNAVLADTVQRVASDSWAKLGGFVAPTIRDRLGGGATIDAVAVLPALYLAFLQRWRRGQVPFDNLDSAIDAEALRALCDAGDPVAVLCGAPGLWGPLAGDERLVAAVRRAARAVELAWPQFGGATTAVTSGANRRRGRPDPTRTTTPPRPGRRGRCAGR